MTTPLASPHPRLHIVCDATQDKARMEFVHGLHDRTSGRLVVDVAAEGYGLQSVMDDVLEALGKPVDGLGANRDARRCERCAALWLGAEEFKQVFVLSADELGAREWNALTRLASIAGCDLWLVVYSQPLPRRLRALLKEWPFEWVSFEDLASQWKDASRPPPRGRPVSSACAEEAVFPTPRVPEDDFMTFLESCERLLAPEHLREVQAHWREAASSIWRLKPAADSFNREAGLAEVRRLLSQGAGFDECIARLRGAQAAFFMDWWLLEVPIDALMGAWANLPRGGLDPTAVEQLREVHDPRAAAAAAIALSSRWTPPQLVALNMDDVSLDGSAVRRSGEWEVVHERARPFLRVQRYSRLLDGAGPSTPFFTVVATTGEHVRQPPQRLTTQLRRLMAATGLSVAAGWTRLAPETDDRWLARRGIALRQLPRP